ncbi:MAG: hypothetical protein O2954_13735 [bacterium]|nr:hypothetical protein [bacterium]
MEVRSQTSRVRFGFARVNITPPVGIYHRMWGAARHDRATGVHRPVFADVLVFAPLNGDGNLWVRANLDLVCLVVPQHNALVLALAEAAGVLPEQVDVAYSHTHSSGWYVPDRIPLPGGERIEPYLVSVAENLAIAVRQARKEMREVTVTYGAGRCNMAANRDCPDGEGMVCGFNPNAAADDTVLVGRVTDSEGGIVATIVNYACHPTTLAWENTLLSSDYVGAMREVVERETGAPCTFALGPCGDLGPRDGFVGDLAVADRNGKQLGFAALSALMAMGPPGTDFEYAGPVVSGATLGAWRHAPFGGERETETGLFRGGVHTVDLPMRKGLDREQVEADLARWLDAEKTADASGDAVVARDAGARAERARRWLGRLDQLPQGGTYSMPFSVRRMGDAVWVTCGGEPYSLLQTELRQRFPNFALVVSPLVGAMPVAYLLRKDAYGKGLYQEEPSCLAPGCLETLVEAISTQVKQEVIDG